jgi:hypothetical protein
MDRVKYEAEGEGGGDQPPAEMNRLARGSERGPPSPPVKRLRCQRPLLSSNRVRSIFRDL